MELDPTTRAMLAEDDLEDFLPDYDPDEPPTPEADSERRYVAWSLRKLRRAEDDLAAIDAIYEQRLAELVEWRDARAAVVTNEAERVTVPLEQYARALYVETGKKTLDLPEGKLKLSKRTASIGLDDDEGELFAAWAREHDPKGELSTVRPKLAAVKAHLKATGELPAGLNLVTPGDDVDSLRFKATLPK